MIVVAILRLATPVAEEAGALAADLGTLAYEEKLKLSVGLPAVVLSTPDEERAQSLLVRLLQRGHAAVAISSDEVVAASAMISLKRFQLDDDALVAPDRPDARLPWDDLSALIRATHRRQGESVEVVSQKKFDLTRAIVTGGLVVSKSTKREVISRSDEREPVLYLFRRSGQTPWILREQGTHYAALGEKLAPTALRNFTLTVEELKRRALKASYDERLLTRKSSPEELDLLAHLLSLSEAPAGPPPPNHA